MMPWRKGEQIGGRQESRTEGKERVGVVTTDQFRGSLWGWKYSVSIVRDTGTYNIS